MPDSGFEWDDAKERTNTSKHGVSFTAAQRAFLDPKRVLWEDTAHSAREQRYFCFGKTPQGILTVRFTIRGGRIRIIGAGYWRRGKVIYEKQNQIHR